MKSSHNTCCIGSIENGLSVDIPTEIAIIG